MRTILIDGDVLVYRAAAAFEEVRAHEERDGAMTRVICYDEAAAKRKASADVELLAQTLDANHVVVCFSDTENFRKAVLPTYKGNRRNVLRPICLQEVRAHVCEQWPTKTKPRLEADDVMGILATHPTLISGERVICSIDKDLRQIPGLLCASMDGSGEVESIDPDAAEKFFYTQILTGDSVDGYTGIPGIGAVKAAEILARGASVGKTPWETIVIAYQTHGLTETDAVRQARLARILRWDDYDYELDTPILWSPRETERTPAA